MRTALANGRMFTPQGIVSGRTLLLDGARIEALVAPDDPRCRGAELEDLKSVFGAGSRVFAAGLAGEVVAVRAGQRPTRSINPSQALVVWRPRR